MTPLLDISEISGFDSSKIEFRSSPTEVCGPFSFGWSEGAVPDPSVAPWHVHQDAASH